VLDEERCYRAMQSRDARFDGWFYVAVRTTGIYCRPSCPVRPPKRVNVSFFPTAAAAHGAGYRACKRCRPDATPGSPEWNIRTDAVARAMRLIADGVVDRDGVDGLARRLGYSGRHLHRLLIAEVGAGPLALARAQRAQTARVLLETTDLTIATVAFASGFSSVRQFNDTIRAVFARTPTELRRSPAQGRQGPIAPGVLTLRLPYRAPMDAAHLFDFLAIRAVPGLEEGSADGYRRVLALPHGSGVVEIDADLGARLHLDDLRDLTAAVQRTRWLLDLDADPEAVDELLGRDGLLGPGVRRRPGIRVPGTVDGGELVVRAVLGQQVSVAGARTIAGRLVGDHGKPLTTPSGRLTHQFPDAQTLAGLRPESLPLPHSRATALVGLAAAVADGRVSVNPGADPDELTAQLLALPGIGPWTANYVRMRATRDPDAFLPTDLGVRRALAALGQPSDPRSADALAARWRPWRSYAVQHLWLQGTVR
jgi:AraC family transcriptional regulator of adaptative response / DNA-3-methyladenine glycosylase II